MLDLVKELDARFDIAHLTAPAEHAVDGTDAAALPGAAATATHGREAVDTSSFIDLIASG